MVGRHKFQKGENNIAKREDIRKKISIGVSRSLIGSKRRLGTKVSEETKKKLREISNKQWASSEHRLKMKSILDELHNKTRGKSGSKEFIEKCRNKIFTVQHRSNLSKSKQKEKHPMWGRKQSQEHMIKYRAWRKTFKLPVKDTSIELKIQNSLKELGIEFYTHQYVNIKYGYQCDILIPIQEGIAKKTIIECDGDYWHGNLEKFKLNQLNKRIQSQRVLDYERTYQLEEQGFKVIRLWESEIKEISKEKLYSILFNGVMASTK